MKQSTFKLLAVFFLSIALLAYEIAVMRTFSVGSWSNFGSMVISIALLGFGLAGTLLTFLQRWIKAKPNGWLSMCAVLLMPAMAIANVLAQLVPFNPVMIVADASQVLLIGMYYLIYAIPFFTGALFIGVAFIALSSRIHQLYFWNLIGSGLGGFFILAFMYIFPPHLLVIPLLVIALIAALLCYIRYDEEKKKICIKIKNVSLSVLLFIVSILLILSFGEVRVSEYKPVSYARQFPDTKLDHHSYSPTGEMHVYTSSFFHSAPGLSDNVALYLKEMPRNAFKGLYIDGGGPIIIPRKLQSNEQKYLEFLPMAAPYLLKKEPRVLLVKLGGGMSVFTALQHDAKKVTVVEPDHAIVNLIKNVDVITDFNENVLNDPRIEVISGEPRAYCVTTKNDYDLVEISLIDSIGLSQTGGYPVDENYTYTVEAVEDFIECLDKNGMLSITVWNRLTPPRNVPKLIGTVTKALKNKGIVNFEKNIFIFNVLLSTATVLVKVSEEGFTAEEIDELHHFCKKMSFDMSYYPGMVVREKDFNRILATYTEQYMQPIQDTRGNTSYSEQGNVSRGDETPSDEYPDLLQDDMYHFSMFWLIQGKEKQLFDRYIFNIKPATDNRPYYTAYLKPETIPMFMDELGEISEEWGYLLLLGTLIQSIFFGILIIILPITTRWKDLFKGRKGTIGVIIYYACLGLGYMLIEIFLIQKLVFFLGDPIFSVSIVITGMLILSGMGSLFSSRFTGKKAFGVRIAVAGIALSLIFYVFGLNPVLRYCLGLHFSVKVLLSVLFIAPAAFFMGIPFPSGLSTLSKNRARLLPWAWGMNGALSVTGSVIARLISISTGFIWVLALAGVLYLIVALVFRANEATDAASS